MTDDLQLPAEAGSVSGVAHFHNAAFDLVTKYGAGVPVRLLLGYDSLNPYAVGLVFDGCATWVFARDLLADGLVMAVGEGDVRVRPSAARGDATLIELESPGGHAQFEAPTEQLSGFLACTYEIVPRGDERHHFDIDRLLPTWLMGEES